MVQLEAVLWEGGLDSRAMNPLDLPFRLHDAMNDWIVLCLSLGMGKALILPARA